MCKKIYYYIFVILLMMTFLFNQRMVEASENAVAHYIFDKQTIKKDEEFTLTLILENYSDLSTFQFVSEVDEEVFEPIVKNDEYFLEPTLSLFKKEEIYENTYLEKERILKFVAITKGGKSYDSTGLNQVFTIYFLAKKDIDKIERYFYESDSGGSRILLINKKAKEIKTSINYSEALKSIWEKDVYEVEVYGSLPDIENDIKILNRQMSEYKIEVMVDELSFNNIGSFVLKVKIYDFITSQVIYLAKPVKIIDTIAPSIEIENDKVILEDVKIDLCNFEYFIVSDNYDLNPTLLYKYYNDKNEEIASLVEFKKYLKSNKLGIISLSAIDSSNNQSDEKRIVVEIKDTMAPYINEITKYEVLDTKIEEFNLESLFIIKDDYDRNPKFLYNIKTVNGVDYLDALNRLYEIVIEYWVEDDSKNSSIHYELKITLIDTISPIIKNVNDIAIADEDLYLYLNNHHLLECDFEISDNFNKELKLNIVYFNNGKIITENDFFDNLRKGLNGSISYQVIDSFGNKSEELIQKVSVIDDTAPIIEINNLENEKQYLGPITIDYVIKDNIDEELEIIITVNDELYNGEEITDLKEYVVYVSAKDKSGNISIKEITFEIVEKNFFGCVDGFDCEENNYAVGLIIGIIIVVIVGVVVTIEILYIRNKKTDNLYVEE